MIGIVCSVLRMLSMVLERSLAGAPQYLTEAIAFVDRGVMDVTVTTTALETWNVVTGVAASADQFVCLRKMIHMNQGIFVSCQKIHKAVVYATGISRDGGTIGIQMNVNVLSMAVAMVTQTTLKQDKSVKDDANVDTSPAAVNSYNTMNDDFNICE